MNKRLVSILAEVFQVRETEIRPDLMKDDVGAWDSLKQMDLVVVLEKSYRIELSIPDILRMGSVATIMDVLKEKGVNLAD